MSEDAVIRVESACAGLVEAGEIITFGAVAECAGMSKATLYRRPELRAIVEEHRISNREAHTLTGILVELDQLRQGLEAVATKVRRHEEELRPIRRQSSKQR
jgi:hypothetical protein